LLGKVRERAGNLREIVLLLREKMSHKRIVKPFLWEKQKISTRRRIHVNISSRGGPTAEVKHTSLNMLIN